MHADIAAAFDLSRRVAVVTGAGGGIGAQIAVTLAQAGADVVCADLDADRLGATADLVRDVGRTATSVATDVSRKEHVDALAAAALEQHARIDVWANVAGILRRSPMVDTTEDELDAVIAVNLKGVFWGCAAAMRAMTAAGRGSIINVASGGADMPAPQIGAYAATKAAVMMLTRTVATEAGPHGVRANAIAPGWVDTPMTSVHWTNPDGTVDEDRRAATIDAMASISPLRMTGRPVDMAWCALYLASDASRYMTGQVLRPNGGVVMP